MIKINEGKQTGVLYHYTSVPGVLKILSDDCLESYGSISFTRNKQFHKQTRVMIPTAARFVVDGSKLSNRYRLEPYNDFHFVDLHSSYHKDLESEERIVGRDVKPFSPYIIGIDLLDTCVLKYDYEREGVKEMVSHFHDLGYSIKHLVDIHLVKKYIIEKYGIDCHVIEV